MSDPSMADAPFHCPPDPMIGGMTIDLPPPVSVNRSRKIDWEGKKLVARWISIADRFVLAAKARKEVRFDRLERFELKITLSEQHVRIDLDNGLKLLIDYLRHREIIADDAKRHLRKLTVDWGHAPAGVKISIVPLPSSMKAVRQRAEARA